MYYDTLWWKTKIHLLSFLDNGGAEEWRDSYIAAILSGTGLYAAAISYAYLGITGLELLAVSSTIGLLFTPFYLWLLDERNLFKTAKKYDKQVYSYERDRDYYIITYKNVDNLDKILNRTKPLILVEDNDRISTYDNRFNEVRMNIDYHEAKQYVNIAKKIDPNVKNIMNYKSIDEYIQNEAGVYSAIPVAYADNSRLLYAVVGIRCEPYEDLKETKTKLKRFFY